MNRFIFWFFLSMFTITIHAQVKSDESIAWEKIESRLYQHTIVQQAIIVKKIRTALYATETGWKGLKINLSPSLQYSDPEGSMAYTQSAIGAELSLPLGTTKEEKEKKIQAFEALDLSDKELRASYGQAYLELFSLYVSAYLAQEAVSVAEAELELYRLKASISRQKVSQGLVPVSDQTDAESEYQAAAEKLIQSRLDLRIAWLNLAYAANLETPRWGMGSPMASGDPVGAIPRFTSVDIQSFLKDMPQPGRLVAVAKANSPAILAQQQKLDKAKRAIVDHSSVNIDILPKIMYATPNIATSLGFSSLNGSVLVGSSWTIYKNEKLNSGGSSQPPDHSLTFSLGISASLTGEGPKEKEALIETAVLEENRLSYLQQSLDLLIRSKYTSYLKARDSVAEAERIAKVAKADSEIILARRKVGQISPEDEAAHTVLLERVSFNLKKAQLNLLQAYLAMIQTANAWDMIARRF